MITICLILYGHKDTAFILKVIIRTKKYKKKFAYSLAYENLLLSLQHQKETISLQETDIQYEKRGLHEQRASRTRGYDRERGLRDL